MIKHENFENKNQKLFDRWSAFYDTGFNRLLFFERTYRQIIGLLKNPQSNYLKPGSSLLDVACGTGEIIARLAPENPAVQFMGADFTAGMIAKAKQKTVSLPNVEIREANVTQLPFEDNHFDVVLCSDAFHHFFDPTKALQQIYRVLKPGGLFLLVDPAFNNPFFNGLANLFLKKLEHAHHYYSQKELERLLVSNKFVVEHKLKYYFNNYFLCFK